MTSSSGLVPCISDIPSASRRMWTKEKTPESYGRTSPLLRQLPGCATRATCERLTSRHDPMSRALQRSPTTPRPVLCCEMWIWRFAPPVPGLRDRSGRELHQSRQSGYYAIQDSARWATRLYRCRSVHQLEGFVAKNGTHIQDRSRLIVLCERGECVLPSSQLVQRFMESSFPVLSAPGISTPRDWSLCHTGDSQIKHRALPAETIAGRHRLPIRIQPCSFALTERATCRLVPRGLTKLL